MTQRAPGTRRVGPGLSEGGWREPSCPFRHLPLCQEVLPPPGGHRAPGLSPPPRRMGLLEGVLSAGLSCCSPISRQVSTSNPAIWIPEAHGPGPQNTLPHSTLQVTATPSWGRSADFLFLKRLRTQQANWTGTFRKRPAPPRGSQAGPGRPLLSPGLPRRALTEPSPPAAASGFPQEQRLLPALTPPTGSFFGTSMAPAHPPRSGKGSPREPACSQAGGATSYTAQSRRPEAPRPDRWRWAVTRGGEAGPWLRGGKGVARPTHSTSFLPPHHLSVRPTPLLKKESSN